MWINAIWFTFFYFNESFLDPFRITVEVTYYGSRNT